MSKSFRRIAATFAALPVATAVVAVTVFATPAAPGTIDSQEAIGADPASAVAYHPVEVSPTAKLEDFDGQWRTAAVDDLDEAISSAEDVYESSTDTVLDDDADTLDDLDGQIVAARGIVTIIKDEQDEADQWVATHPEVIVSPDSVTEPAPQFTADSDDADKAIDRLSEAVQSVDDAVDNYEAEQKRIAEEQARLEAEQAAERAAQAERDAVAQGGDQGSGDTDQAPASQGPSVDYVENVWTTGWQNEIDACNGAVALDGHYPVATIAEHNHCGGASFPTWEGATVQVNGPHGGLYRVIGVVAHLNGNVHTTGDLPRGYDLLYQTCFNGYSDMGFTALERIG